MNYLLDTLIKTIKQQDRRPFKSAYFKAIEQDIISVGRNHKKNMKKRMNKKNKEANAPPAYEAEHNIDAIGPSIDDEGPPRYS